MSTYTSFITEFGLVGFIAFLAVTLLSIARNATEPFGTICPTTSHRRTGIRTAAGLDKPRP
ncbi:hypothetical protein [Bifidobacterium sp. UTBIF-78]|uniref:hypothetical protein n=1 Tax=Bifidobacterium sp. UTBIF-78 TaxID=1465263 RepID=UPI0011263CD1|nr:hypothetical protein [Bifidobacterium sp. UTBIF-78]